MTEVIVVDKEEYLKNNYPFEDVPKLTDRKRCIHCDNVIIVGEYKVFKQKRGEELICCPNAPACDGTVIDWFHLD